MTNTNYLALIREAAGNGNDYAKTALTCIKDATMSPEEIAEHAYQLTAYELYCGVDRDDLKKYIKDEFMGDPDIGAINEFLMENRYSESIAYPMEDFDSMCERMNPSEIARACYYGDFKPCDDLFYFNAYNNITSCNEDQYIEKWRDEVNEWILSEEKREYMPEEAQEIMDFDNSMAIMCACDTLISLGF